MKKLISCAIVLLILVSSIVVFANTTSYDSLDVSYDLPSELYEGDIVTLQTNSNRYTYQLSETGICSYSSLTRRLTALKAGNVILYKLDSSKKVVASYLIRVLAKEETVVINGSNQMRVGEEMQVNASSSLNKKINYVSSDTNILTVDSKGNVTAINPGMARVIAESETGNAKDEIYVIVTMPTTYQTKEEVVDVDMSDMNQVFSLIAKHTTQSMMSISTYYVKNGATSLYDQGCGFVYKRVAHLLDGTTNDTDELNYNDVSYYEYFLVTNKHLVTTQSYNSLLGTTSYKDVDLIKLYYGESQTISASIVAYDSKVDVCVLTFNSNMYFPTVNLGDSTLVKNGEFIISIGNGTGNEYFRSVSFGIVSSSLRYISDDTDGDGTNDWDAQYIQHDAATNTSDCGSPIINLKGEVIGINTAKKISTNSGTKVEDLSFAIPSSVLLTLLPSLEKGEVPERPRIGITVISVVDILANKDYYESVGYSVPEGVMYGFYVTDVTIGGIAYLGGVKANDILIKFNDVDLVYMYQIRAELDHYVVGSGASAYLTVLRNGKEVVLTLVF